MAVPNADGGISDPHTRPIKMNGTDTNDFIISIFLLTFSSPASLAAYRAQTRGDIGVYTANQSSIKALMSSLDMTRGESLENKSDLLLPSDVASLQAYRDL